MLLLRQTYFAGRVRKPHPVMTPRILTDGRDNCLIAEWLGWTDIDTPDAISYRGWPPERWLEKPYVRWSSSTIRRIKKSGVWWLPAYCIDEREWYWVTREIEERGLVEEYERQGPPRLERVHHGGPRQGRRPPHHVGESRLYGRRGRHQAIPGDKAPRLETRPRKGRQAPFYLILGGVISFCLSFSWLAARL